MIYLRHLLGYLLESGGRVRMGSRNGGSGSTSTAIERDASISAWKMGWEVSRSLAALRSVITRSYTIIFDCS